MRSLRVLHVIPSVSSADGGPARAMVIMENALSKAGVRVTTLTTDNDVTGILPQTGGSRVYAHKWTDTYKFAPSLVPWLYKNIISYDVVHIHGMFSFAPTMAACTARWFGIPYIVRPLGALNQYGINNRRRFLKRISIALLERWILRYAAAVHFTSKEERDEAEVLGLSFRGVVVPLGVERCKAEAEGILVEEYQSLLGRHVILFLSRIDPKKNLEGLIDAVGGSDVLRNSCAVLIAGKGERSYVASLKARATKLGIADRVVWLGHIEGARKNAALAAAHVFALPSFSENFGIAVVEALFAGIPCVLGDGVAIARELEGAGACVTVAPTADLIARALEKVLKSGSVRHEMGLRASAYAERNFSTSVMAQRLIAIYDEAHGIHGSNVA